jgi:MinD-like ATPase involved in chromosome partitioning or flagellar assembly
MTILERDKLVIPDLRLAPSTASGKLVSSWGTAGSGKTSIAINIAFELALAGESVLLVDLDSRRPSIASCLGLTEPGAALTAVLRLARQDRLDASELERLSSMVKFQGKQLQILTGLNSLSRWPELDSKAILDFSSFARSLFDWVIFDLNDDIETGSFSADTGMERNQATREILQLCDYRLQSFAADAVGVNRYLSLAKETDFETWVIANRVRASTIGRNAERQLRDTIFKVSRVTLRAVVPEDQAGLDLCMLEGKPLCLSAKSSKAREAIRLIATDLLDA